MCDPAPNAGKTLFPDTAKLVKELFLSIASVIAFLEVMPHMHTLSGHNLVSRDWRRQPSRHALVVMDTAAAGGDNGTAITTHVDGDRFPQHAISLQWHTVLSLLQDGRNGSQHPG